jgi:hypothetical protein
MARRLERAIGRPEDRDTHEVRTNFLMYGCHVTNTLQTPQPLPPRPNDTTADNAHAPRLRATARRVDCECEHPAMHAWNDATQQRPHPPQPCKQLLAGWIVSAFFNDGRDNDDDNDNEDPRPQTTQHRHPASQATACGVDCWCFLQRRRWRYKFKGRPIVGVIFNNDG